MQSLFLAVKFLHQQNMLKWPGSNFLWFLLIKGFSLGRCLICLLDWVVYKRKRLVFGSQFQKPGSPKLGGHIAWFLVKAWGASCHGGNQRTGRRAWEEHLCKRPRWAAGLLCDGLFHGAKHTCPGTSVPSWGWGPHDLMTVERFHHLPASLHLGPEQRKSLNWGVNRFKLQSSILGPHTIQDMITLCQMSQSINWKMQKSHLRL